MDGKRNRRIDHLVHTLVNDIDTHFQNVHTRQTVGLDGPDLAGKRRREILASAGKISRDSIQQLEPTRFHVASQSRPGAYYVIDLDLVNCNCKNFPFAQFCKHIAAIYVHFPELTPEVPSTISPSVDREVPEALQRVITPQESLHSLTQEIALLSHKLSDHSDQSTSPVVLQAVCLARYSLEMVLASS
jgi:hypothetical protein